MEIVKSSEENMEAGAVKMFPNSSAVAEAAFGLLVMRKGAPIGDSALFHLAHAFSSHSAAGGVGAHGLTVLSGVGDWSVLPQPLVEAVASAAVGVTKSAGRGHHIFSLFALLSSMLQSGVLWGEAAVVAEAIDTFKGVGDFSDALARKAIVQMA